MDFPTLAVVGGLVLAISLSLKLPPSTPLPATVKVATPLHYRFVGASEQAFHPQLLAVDVRAMLASDRVEDVVKGRSTPLVMLNSISTKAWVDRGVLGASTSTSSTSSWGDILLKGVYTQPHTDPLFFNDDAGALLTEPLASGGAYSKKHTVQTLSVSATISSSPTDPDNRALHYWSGPLDLVAPPHTAAAAAATAATPGTPPLPPPGPTPTELAALAPGPNLRAARGWLATPGVQAALHYDTYINVLAQLVGTKRVFVFRQI
jgi:hypothetical protein